tara:strand:+ start:1717 stop:1905 length:189 start_codon:yes stop_codon:yes gene_type:complete
MEAIKILLELFDFLIDDLFLHKMNRGTIHVFSNICKAIDGLQYFYLPLFFSIRAETIGCVYD